MQLLLSKFLLQFEAIFKVFYFCYFFFFISLNLSDNSSLKIKKLTVFVLTLIIVEKKEIFVI